MNFSGLSLYSPEIGVRQPNVYGDIQSHHNMSTIGMAKWDIARKKWKNDNVEIKIITFIMELGVK